MRMRQSASRRHVIIVACRRGSLATRILASTLSVWHPTLPYPNPVDEAFSSTQATRTLLSAPRGGAPAAVCRHHVFFWAHWHHACFTCGLLCPHPVRAAVERPLQKWLQLLSVGTAYSFGRTGMMHFLLAGFFARTLCALQQPSSQSVHLRLLLQIVRQHSLFPCAKGQLPLRF